MVAAASQPPPAARRTAGREPGCATFGEAGLVGATRSERQERNTQASAQEASPEPATCASIPSTVRLINQRRSAALRSARASTPAWLWAVPVFSCCMLGFVPPLVLATKLKTRESALWAAGFAAAFLLGFTMIGMQPDQADNFSTNLGAVLVVISGIGGAVYSVVVGSRMDWGIAPPRVSVPAPVAAVPLQDPNAGAIAGVLAVRQKRTEARSLAQRDPQMARELRIGRPDTARFYDDGGLVDIDSAQRDHRYLAEHPSGRRGAHVEIRQQLGKFERVDDLLNLVGLEPNTYDQASDRIILL